MLYVYVGCFAFGVVYALLSFIFGGHGFDGGAPDHSGIGHAVGDAHAAAGDAEIPSPLNPLVVSSAITVFGAAGIVSKVGLKMGDLSSSAVAITIAGIIGAAIFFGIVRVMYGSQSNSTFSLDDLIGIDAEVITPIPESGMGEVSYTMNGMRYNLSAKSAYNENIQRGECVKIKNITGNAAVVARKITADKLDAFDIRQREKRSEEKGL